MEPEATINSIRMRQDDPSVADVDRLIELRQQFPNDPYLLDFLGDCSQLVDHPRLPFDYAKQCYIRAVESDPTYWDAHISLGHWYDIAEDFEEACCHFRLAIEYGANDDARIALASVLAQMGNRAGALAELDLCEDADDNDVSKMRSEILDGLHDPIEQDSPDTNGG